MKVHILKTIEKIRSQRRLHHKSTIYNGRKRDEYGLILTTATFSNSPYKGAYPYVRYKIVNDKKIPINTGTLRSQFHIGTGKKKVGIIDCGNYDPAFLKRASALQTDLWDEGGSLIVKLVNNGYNSDFLVALYKKYVHLWLKTNITHEFYQKRAKISLGNKRNNSKKAKRSASFKSDVIREYGSKCAVCGATAPVEGAHIIPKSKHGECNVYNGLPLCKNHHYIFDKHLWSINPHTYEIEVHDDHTHQTLHLSMTLLINDKYRTHPERQKCLHTHYNEFLGKNQETKEQTNNILQFCNYSH